MHICTGGNIGRGMLELIKEQEISDAVLLELSSFQLERTTKFAPELAIWTNFSANHIDWHENEKNYFIAKQNIMRHQQAGQKALLPLNLIEQFSHLHKKTAQWYAFSQKSPLDKASWKLLLIL